MQMRVLSGEQVDDTVEMSDAIDAMRHAFARLSEGAALLPPRVALEMEAGVSLFMPGALARDGTAAAKIVSVFADNAAHGLPTIHAVVLVLDPKTGRPLALMDGTRLTALRTGAVGGLAADLMARRDARVAAVFGSGVQARTQLDALQTVRPIEEVRICSPTRTHAGSFAQEISERYGLAVRVTDPRGAVHGADVIVAATDATTPVFDGRLLEPGQHVTGVGSFTPAMRELPPELVARARVVVDQLEAARAEAGELIDAARRGVWGWGRLHAELGDLVRGLRPGREGPEELTFFKSVGVAVQDVVLAGRVLERAEEKDVGTIVEL